MHSNKKRSQITVSILLLLLLLFPACSMASALPSNISESTPQADTDPGLHQVKISSVPSQAPSGKTAPVSTITASVTKTADLPAATATASKSKSKDTSKKINPTADKKLIAIDAGHQAKGNNETEPIGPGASERKPKVSSGTQGVSTGVAEYKLNLVISKKVKAELLKRGYDVFMIRDTHNVNISNRERAKMAAKSGADIFIRIHADSSASSDANGTSTLYPSPKNPYVPQLSKASKRLSMQIVNSICKLTSSKNRGAIAADNMSGINWCTIPVSIIEMGFMSNVREDKQMQTKTYQNKIVQGICDGIDRYYAKSAKQK